MLKELEMQACLSQDEINYRIPLLGILVLINNELRQYVVHIVHFFIKLYPHSLFLSRGQVEIYMALYVRS